MITLLMLMLVSCVQIEASSVYQLPQGTGFNIHRVANIYCLTVDFTAEAYHKFIYEVDKDMLSHLTGEEIEALFMNWIETHISRCDINAGTLHRIEYNQL